MSDAMDSDVREVIRRRIALRERDGHERLLLDHEALRALLDAADERDQLASALVRAQGPFACCSHCEGDAIHDVETGAHEVPCTLCQSSVGEVERLRDERDQLAAAVGRVRVLHYQHIDSSGTLRTECECGDRWPCPTVAAVTEALS